VHEGLRREVQSRKDIRTLNAAQVRTDASLKAFIDSGHSNGKTKH
jgi:hypothetical protein